MRSLTLPEAFEKTMAIRSTISKLLDSVEYNEFGEQECCVHVDNSDPEQVLQLDIMNDIMEKLAEVEDVLVYMSLPVKGTGYLEKCKGGYREPVSGHTFATYSRLEVLLVDEYHKGPFWALTQLCSKPAHKEPKTFEEINERIYYFEDYEDVPVEGKLVRFREEIPRLDTWEEAE